MEANGKHAHSIFSHKENDAKATRQVAGSPKSPWTDIAAVMDL
jgi:hypothetical protein